MDKFQIADKPSGPWLELDEYKTPQQALDSGRASFQWPVVWVAKMRHVDASDVMPPIEQFMGEVSERLATLHGGTVAEQVTEHLNKNSTVLVDLVWEAVDMILGLDDSRVFVPAKKKSYSRDMQVRPMDFGLMVHYDLADDSDLQGSKPSLKDLI